jgi:hypothetical protein
MATAFVQESIRNLPEKTLLTAPHSWIVPLPKTQHTQQLGR